MNDTLAIGTILHAESVKVGDTVLTLEVEPHWFAGHGLTGYYRFTIRYENEYRPKVAMQVHSILSVAIEKGKENLYYLRTKYESGQATNRFGDDPWLNPATALKGEEPF